MIPQLHIPHCCGTSPARAVSPRLSRHGNLAAAAAAAAEEEEAAAGDDLFWTDDGRGARVTVMGQARRTQGMGAKELNSGWD